MSGCPSDHIIERGINKWEPPRWIGKGEVSGAAPRGEQQALQGDAGVQRGRKVVPQRGQKYKGDGSRIREDNGSSGCKGGGACIPDEDRGSPGDKGVGQEHVVQSRTVGSQGTSVQGRNGDSPGKDRVL